MFCSVDDNIFQWSVKMSNFGDCPLQRECDELEQKFGYDYIELQMEFSMDLYPFFPPLVKVNINCLYLHYYQGHCQGDPTEVARQHDVESDDHGDTEADLLGPCQGHEDNFVGHQGIPRCQSQVGQIICLTKTISSSLSFF